MSRLEDQRGDGLCMGAARAPPVHRGRRLPIRGGNQDGRRRAFIAVAGSRARAAASKLAAWIGSPQYIWQGKLARALTVLRAKRTRTSSRLSRLC